MSLIQIDSEDKKTKDTPNPINLNIEKESEIKKLKLIVEELRSIINFNLKK